MNKMLQMSIALLLITSLVGCGVNKNEEVEKKENETGTTDQATDTEVNKEENEVSNDDVNGTTDQKLELADDVADKIVEMEEVESANVIVTDHNAYVGVMLKEGVNSTEELDNKIGDQARAANANFKNVYVSTNPDFAKQFSDYGAKIRANEPVEGFFKEFSDTVQRVFPDAH